MLTPTELHYLVGLLTQVSEGSDIEIELGDMVYDQSAEQERDVDITVKKKNEDGSISIYKGVEVKNHSKPLNVIHVEQLCMKFIDIQDINYRAIVSANGYTEGAIKKAKAHDVNLLEIADWNNPMEGFRTKFSKDFFKFQIEYYEWETQPHVQINVDENKDSKIQLELNSKIVDDAKKPISPEFNVTLLTSNIAQNAIDAFKNMPEAKLITESESQNVNINITPTDKLNFLIGEELIPILNFTVTGRIKKSIVLNNPDFKVLRQLGHDNPIAGCAITLLNNGNLIGVSCNNFNDNIHSLNIPFEDRIKHKIYKQPL